MRELIVDWFSTVDARLRGRESAAFFGCDGPELQAWIAGQLAAPHVDVMGAGTYRLLSAHGASGGPAVVFSRSLRPPLAWPDATVIDEDVASAVPRMKAGPGGPLRVIGSRSLVRSLVALGLVDRFRILVFPQILAATGEEPLLEGGPDVHLRLDGTRVLDGRLVLLDYAVA